MQKVTKFLEANVEWFALGLAVLFLGWTAWTYLINDPVSKPLENTPVNPANVDSFIEGHAAARLQDKMDPNATPPDFKVQDFTQSIQSKISLDPLQPPELATNYWDYAPFDVSTISIQERNMGPPVVQLPMLPVPQPLLSAAALDTITPPAPANGAAAPVTAKGKDVRLVVAAFTIPWDDLYKQWNTCFGPAGVGQPARLAPAEFQIISITAYRSELINQTWSKNQEVEILNTQGLPDYPRNADKDAANAYLLAVSKQSKTLVAPDFPTFSAGAVWKDPVLYVTNSTNAPNGQIPPDQSRAANPPGFVDVQYRGGPPPGFGGGGPPRFAPPRAPTNPEETPPADQTPTAVAPADGTVDPITVLANPKALPAIAPVEPIAKLSNVPAMPAKSPDLCVYIIDDTADAGKTYRYCISYKVLNPVFNKPPQRVGKNGQAWINQFDLASKFSDYSPAITVPVQTYLFCGQGEGGRKVQFPFEVFTWTDGKWLKDVFNAALGDPIGGLDGGIDYSTGFTFADMRIVRGGKTLVTLVDNDGNVQTKDPTQDANDPNYKKAVQWVEQTKAGGTQRQAFPAGGSPFGPGSSPYGPGGGPPQFGPPGGGPSPYGPPPN